MNINIDSIYLESKIGYLSCWIGLSSLVFSTSSLAHNGEHHEHKKPVIMEESHQEKDSFDQINQQYLNDIKPIFQRSCFACHGSIAEMPWYQSIPGAKQIIESDISEAKVHVDMTKDFPFSGHGSPIEDLDAIDKAVSEGSMPPLRFQIMHWSSRISDKDKEVIRAWTRNGKKILTEISVGQSKHGQ